VNSEGYTETLRSLKKGITRKEAKWMISCFNKTMPGLTQVQPQLMPLHVWGLQCYHYSPDLAPSNFHLFPKLKGNLRGKKFSSDQGVNAAVRQWFLEKKKIFFKNGIQKRVECWQKCIEVGRDYVEK
jgi:histone-lysine N-methyltransferase SETMAR